MKIIAKIKTKYVLGHLDSIAAADDMLLIDKGNLGTSVGYEKAPFYQDNIIYVAKKHRKPVLVATEVAMSAINSDRPNHADIMRVCHIMQKKVDL